MAFTKITQVIQDSIRGVSSSGNGAPLGHYFHIKDLEIVSEQAGARAIAYKDAIVGGKDCTIALGVTTFDATGATGFLDEIDDLIALPCPPYTDQIGGVRIISP